MGFLVLHGAVKGTQGALCLGAQVGGYLDAHGHVLVATTALVQARDTLTLQAEGGVSLGAGGQVVLDLAVDGGDLQFAAQRGVYEGDRVGVVDIKAVPSEHGMGGDGDADDEVAVGAAVPTHVTLTVHIDGLAVVNTGGNLYMDGSATADETTAAAHLAGVLDDMSIATAFRALLLGLHDAEGGALLGLDDTGAVAALAGLHAVGVCGALAVTFLTGFDPLDGKILLTAESGLFKGQPQHFPQVGALHGGVPVVTAAATKAAEPAAAKDGGDPEYNASLRLAIEKAKAISMPNDNINRAIKKGTGELAGETYEELKFEGYGVAGVAVIVEALTDNTNRTTSSVRSTFDKYGGNLGSPGCVSYMFSRKGVIIIEKTDDIDEDSLLETALEAGAEDMQVNEDSYEILTDPSVHTDVHHALTEAGYEIAESDVEQIPSMESTPTDPGDIKKLKKMIELLEDNDDVQKVYTNCSIDLYEE